jgi:endoglucanase
MPVALPSRSSRPLLRIGLGAALVSVLASLALGAPAAAAATRSVGWLHTSGSRILTAAGQPYTIRAVSWFGMETTDCAPHGLWQISLDEGLATIRSFGFNTVRLPFSNECLHRTSPSGSISAAKNPALVGLSPLELMDAVVARAEAHGLSILLDRHRPDSAAQSELWYTPAYPESSWIADWTSLARRYAGTPTVIGADLHNEPHGAACWGCSDPQRDWAAAATRAGNALLSVNPRLLVVVEGVEHQASGDTWWGGGLADVADHPITLDVPARLVYSAHDYPASIASQPWFGAADYPNNLPGQWDKTWGYLQTSGTAPVLLGEFGTKLATTSDRQWLTTLVRYLADRQISFAYWSFNPNSGDTGGLVADDWVTPQVAKLLALRPLGVHPPDRFAVTSVTTRRRPVVR